MSEITVGQEVYYDSNHRGLEAVTITKVGRKWLHFGNGYRACRTSSAVYQGDDHCGYLWLSLDAYNTKMERAKIWSSIRNGLAWNPPDSISTDDLRKAAALLGITPTKKPAQ
jgi:hypothetical protein